MTRAHISDVGLAKIMSDPEHVMRSAAIPSFLTTISRQGQRVLEQIYSSDDALGSNEKGPQSIPEHRMTLALEFMLQTLNHSQLREQIREITLEKARCIYTLQMKKSFFKASKGALPVAI